MNEEKATDVSSEKSKKHKKFKKKKKTKKSKKKREKRHIPVKKYRSSIPIHLPPCPNGVYGTVDMPKYNEMSPIEQKQWREDFRYKYSTLQRGFKDVYIPMFDDDESLEEIHAKYERYIRQVNICGMADSYRNYLIIYFLILEAIATRLLGLPAQGYTIAQMNTISEYDRLMIELGEQWYQPGGGQWPVEYRLIFLSLMNMLILIITNYLGQWIGNENLAKTLVDIVTGSVSQNSQQEDYSNVNPNFQQSPQNQGMDLNTIIGLATQFMGTGNNNTNANNNTSANTNTSQSDNGGGGRRRRRRRGPAFKE
jgi:hypothetical protein